MNSSYTGPDGTQRNTKLKYRIGRLLENLATEKTLLALFGLLLVAVVVVIIVTVTTDSYLTCMIRDDNRVECRFPE